MLLKTIEELTQIDDLFQIETQRNDKNKRDLLLKNVKCLPKIINRLAEDLKEIIDGIINLRNILEQFILKIRMEIDKALRKIEECTKKIEESSHFCDVFRNGYQNIEFFNKYIPEFNMSKELAELKKLVVDKTEKIKDEAVSSIENLSNVAQKLIKLQFLKENLAIFEKDINPLITIVIKEFKKKHGSIGIDKLCMQLEDCDEGSRLISENPELAGQDWRKRREKMQNQDNIEYISKNMSGDNIDENILKSRYENFRETYDNLIKLYLSGKNNNIEYNTIEIVADIKRKVTKYYHQAYKTDSLVWTGPIRDFIPELLAYIFALWTLLNTQYYIKSRGHTERNLYLLMPLAAQILVTFRIFGIGYKSGIIAKAKKFFSISKNIDSLDNNISEVGTGEGKSLILAVTACVFALFGAEIDCSCYSKYLSNRDSKNFLSLFSALGIQNHITYGTFNNLCEKLLNDQCNIRQRIRHLMENNNSNIDAIGLNVKTNIKPRILLIDEIDVFLSQKFYGTTYDCSFLLNSSQISDLLCKLWRETRKSKLTFNFVRNFKEYIECTQKYTNWIFIIEEAVKAILFTIRSYQHTTYFVKDDRICYVDDRSAESNIIQGYNTIFAYFYEHDKGTISRESLERNIGIIVNCGTFSYAEMPKEYSYITGVTGTLKSLFDFENKILEDIYNISGKTYMPSVFGKCNRTDMGIVIVDASEYFMKLRNEIDAIRNANRAILVFFETEKKLFEFYNSKELAGIKNDIQIIIESLDENECDLLLKRSCTIGKATLLTKPFGRGTDFICRNPQLLANGGVHVLQTFFSVEISEEFQIKGRCARQGDTGSYQMILLDDDLEQLVGPDYKKEIESFKPNFYDALDKLRKRKYESLCYAKEININTCKQKHLATKTFMKQLLEGNVQNVVEYLKNENLSLYDPSKNSSRTIVLMDATTSMSSLLSAAKETVCTMFDRASEVLREHHLQPDAFMMQFAVFRNYNCKEDKILQVSSWENKGNNLRNFMDNISPQGGWGSEAIEIGLWHTVGESNSEFGISQVILIGDAPANTKEEVLTKRKDEFGEKYWCTTKHKNPTYYEDELKKLIEKTIPVHCFYLADSAKNNFSEIATKSGGKCEKLDINSKDGANLLTNLVTEEVLNISAGSKANEVIETYRIRYGRRTHT